MAEPTLVERSSTANTELASLPDGCSIAAMTRAEAGELIEWAAAEGWNPGIGDLDVAWGHDPDAFIALHRCGEFIGGGTIVRYGTAAGFMGLFILRAEHRRGGMGRVLWHERLRRLRQRLQADAPIFMDGVFHMAPFYATGGFRLLHRDLRFEGIAAGVPHPDVVGIDAIPFGEIDAYDRGIFGVPRGDFLRRWLTQPGVIGRAVRDATGRLCGYGQLRPCRVGYKYGPVFADDAATACALIDSLASCVRGQQVQLDIPEINAGAMRIVAERGWREAFGCARMVHGNAAALPWAKVFGITSFEFG